MRGGGGVPVKNYSGQAAVETLFTTVFLTTVLFAAIQLMISIMSWLKANEAAQAGLRCALISKGSTADGAEGENPAAKAREAMLYILGTNPPGNIEIWDKSILEDAGTDHSSGPDENGAEVRMFSIHLYVSQKLLFASLLAPLRDYTAHCRMIKPPDWRFYGHAYPGAYEFE